MIYNAMAGTFRAIHDTGPRCNGDGWESWPCLTHRVDTRRASGKTGTRRTRTTKNSRGRSKRGPRPWPKMRARKGVPRARGGGCHAGEPHARRPPRQQTAVRSDIGAFHEDSDQWIGTRQDMATVRCRGAPPDQEDVAGFPGHRKKCLLISVFAYILVVQKAAAVCPLSETRSWSSVLHI